MPIALSSAELDHARRFRDFLASMGVGEVQDVIKLDLSELTVLQHYVITERAQTMAQAIHGPNDWFAEFLPLAARGSNVRCSFRRTAPVSTCIEFELPHAEFLFQPNPQAPGNFALVECLHHATVSVEADRIFLNTGYHRSFARMISAPSGQKPTALLAVVAGATSITASQACGSERTSPRGDQAARFGDFLRDGLFFETALVMRRFQLQLTATVVALNERRNKARALGRGA
jgi:hypothetical protein